MANFNGPQAQKELYDAYVAKQQQGVTLDEPQVVAMFAKILVRQTSRNVASFCTDNELYIAKNPTGIPKSLFVLPGVMVGAQRKVAKKMIKFGSPR